MRRLLACLVALALLGCTSRKAERDAWHRQREAARVPARAPKVLVDRTVLLPNGHSESVGLWLPQASRVDVTITNENPGSAPFTVVLNRAPSCGKCSDEGRDGLIHEEELSVFARSAMLPPGSYTLFVHPFPMLRPPSEAPLLAHIRVVSADPIDELPPSF